MLAAVVILFIFTFVSFVSMMLFKEASQKQRLSNNESSLLKPILFEQVRPLQLMGLIASGSFSIRGNFLKALTFVTIFDPSVMPD